MQYVRSVTLIAREKLAEWQSSCVRRARHTRCCGFESHPRTNSEIWIVTQDELKIEDQRNIMRENIYDVKGKIESARRRINGSDQISERNG